MTRKELRQQGAALRKRLGVASGSPLPGFDAFMDEAILGGIWSRPGLPLPDRMICTLAVLSPLQRLESLRPMIGAALDLGLTPRNIVEVFMQTGLYGGFVTTETSVACAREVFSARGIEIAAETQQEDDDAALEARGKGFLATLHGPRGKEGYAAPGNPITEALYPAAVRYGYGVLWQRAGLTHRQRMLCALAAFTAMGLEDQLGKFAQSGLNVGLTREEIIEAVIQTAPYGGFPRALNGLGILSRLL